MNGMMTPSKGIVLYNYQKPSLKNKSFKKSISKIGYIPQTLGLVKNMSVMDNIMIGALQGGQGSEALENKLRAIREFRHLSKEFG